MAKLQIILIGFVLVATQAVRLHAEPLSPRAPAAPPAIRVLMVVGGAHHDFDVLPKQLADNLNKERDLHVRVTADLAELSKATLDRCDVVLFNTCMDRGLNEVQQKALLAALREGKGMVGMHCALLCFQDWPEWRKMLGGVLKEHAPYGPYKNRVVDRRHPIAAGLPEEFAVVDELYFADERCDYIHVIVQTTHVPEGRSGKEPQAWTTRYAGGRVFFTSFGHDEKAQTNPACLKLLANGIRWAAGRLGPATILSELERKEGFVPLFDSKTLNGWRYESAHWKVKDGIIIGKSPPRGLEDYSYLIAEEEFGDFVLRCSVKLIKGNSGVQFRSRAKSKSEVSGYQADVVVGGWGVLHEMNGRGNLAVSASDEFKTAASPNDWNEMEISARGPRNVIRVNGVTTAEWTETDPSRPRAGVIALQLHRGEPMEVRCTNIRIKRLDGAKHGRK